MLLCSAERALLRDRARLAALLISRARVRNYITNNPQQIGSILSLSPIEAPINSLSLCLSQSM